MKEWLTLGKDSSGCRRNKYKKGKEGREMKKTVVCGRVFRGSLETRKEEVEEERVSIPGIESTVLAFSQNTDIPLTLGQAATGHEEHVEGPVTWPAPALGKTCCCCKFYGCGCF